MTPGRPSWMRLPDSIFLTAELKSALQKLLRRRDPRAYDVTRLLLTTPESASSLLRRLAIIAPEEGVHGATPEAVELMFAYGRRETRAAVTGDAVLRLIARLMATPRDKDPAYLQGWPDVADAAALPAERAAAALWQTWSAARGQEVLRAAWAALPDGPARDVVLALRRRAGMGVLEGDLRMFCGIALTLQERERAGEVAVLPGAEEPVPPAGRLDTLPWWCLDPHIAVGKKALKQVLAVSPYADWNRAFAIWFRLSSDQLAGYVEREGWRARRFAQEIGPEDRAWWESVEPIAREVIETELARRTAAPKETPLEVTPAAEHAWSVASESTPGHRYRVTYAPVLDAWTCQCLAFQHSQRCKHVDAVRALEARRPRQDGEVTNMAQTVDQEPLQLLHDQVQTLRDETRRVAAAYRAAATEEREKRTAEREQKRARREAQKAERAARQELRALTKAALETGQAQAAVQALRPLLGRGADQQ